MSFILEALKKSEHERRRKLGPDVAGLPRAAAARTRQRWIILIGAIVLLNGLAWLLFVWSPRQEDPLEVAPTRADANPRPARVAETAPPPALPGLRPEVRRLAGEVLATPGSPGETTQPAQPAQPRLERPPPARVTRGTPQSLPTVDEGVLDGDPALADLRLELHVYSERPEGRFIYLNSRKYREGGRLPGGIVVEEILPEGAVLNRGGSRFLLPRE